MKANVLFCAEEAALWIARVGTANFFFADSPQRHLFYNMCLLVLSEKLKHQAKAFLISPFYFYLLFCFNELFRISCWVTTVHIFNL